MLELLKNTLATRHYYLLFGIQIFRDAVEMVKRVMTKEKLNNKLAGQSFTPHMSFKTHPTAKNKIVKFDEYTNYYTIK